MKPLKPMRIPTAAEIPGLIKRAERPGKIAAPSTARLILVEVARTRTNSRPGKCIPDLDWIPWLIRGGPTPANLLELLSQPSVRKIAS